MVGIHVRLDLEDEPCHFRLGRLHQALVAILAAWRRREAGEPVDEIAHAEIAQGRAEKDRREVPFAKRLEIEPLEAGFGELRLFPPRGDLAFLGEQLVEERIVHAGHGHGAGVVRRVEPANTTIAEVVGAGKAPPPADGPGDRRHIQRQGLLDFVEQFERIARLTVELVDEGDDGGYRAGGRPRTACACAPRCPWRRRSPSPPNRRPSGCGRYLPRSPRGPACRAG